jgi:predicted dinucleotide-binding enzyme
MPEDVLATGAQAVTTAEAVQDVDVLILSIPFEKIPSIADLVKSVPDDVVIIDTSNYYPMRDGNIDAVDNGQVESLWVTEVIGRPLAKAWNAIGSDSLANKGAPAGDPERLAIPVAADRVVDREVAVSLVEQTGFDAFDAGSLADSWRMQPGAPIYCTDLTRDEMPAALAGAETHRSPKRRELAVAAIAERLDSATINPGADYLVRLNRALFM